MNEQQNQQNDSPAFDQAAWIMQAKRLLDDSARDLDGAALSRLNRSRQTALKLVSRRSPRLWLLPTGLASACALLLALAIWPQHHAPLSGAGKAPPSDSVALDASDTAAEEDAPEFYQDLEFYAWLDAQTKDGDG